MRKLMLLLLTLIILSASLCLTACDGIRFITDAANGDYGDIRLYIESGNFGFLYVGDGEEFTTPSTVDSIFKRCFINNRTLKSVNISEKIKRIDEYAFSDMYALESINVDESNPYYKSVDGSLYSKDLSVLYRYAPARQEKSFEIPEEVRRIERGAFDDCRFLEVLTIPKGVSFIPDDVFAGDCGVLSIEISGDNPNYKSIDGNVYSKDGSCFIKYASGKTSPSFTLPAWVTRVNDYAFGKCPWLSQIEVDPENEHFSSTDGNLYNKGGIRLIRYAPGKTESEFILPANVTIISGGAFLNSTALKVINIPKRSFGRLILSENSFEGCASLEKIYLPEGTSIMGENVFSACNLLTDIYYGDTIEKWRSDATAMFNVEKKGLTIHCTDGNLEN